jgi:hypothetical protein
MINAYNVLNQGAYCIVGNTYFALAFGRTGFGLPATEMLRRKTNWPERTSGQFHLFLSTHVGAYGPAGFTRFSRTLHGKPPPSGTTL